MHYMMHESMMDNIIGNSKVPFKSNFKSQIPISNLQISARSNQILREAIESYERPVESSNEFSIHVLESFYLILIKNRNF